MSGGTGCQEVILTRIASLFFILFLPLFANHISWMGDYSKALLRAKKEHKPLMVLLVKRDCSECNRVISKLFMNQSYIDNLNTKVISVIVTKDSKTAYPIELLYSTHFPTLFFVNSKDEVFLSEPFYGVITKKDIKSLLTRGNI